MDILTFSIFLILIGLSLGFLLLPNRRSRRIERNNAISRYPAKAQKEIFEVRLPTKTDAPNPFLDEDGTLKRGIAPEKK